MSNPSPQVVGTIVEEKVGQGVLAPIRKSYATPSRGLHPFECFLGIDPEENQRLRLCLVAKKGEQEGSEGS